MFPQGRCNLDAEVGAGEEAAVDVDHHAIERPFPVRWDAELKGKGILPEGIVLRDGETVNVAGSEFCDQERLVVE